MPAFACIHINVTPRVSENLTSITDRQAVPEGDSRAGLSRDAETGNLKESAIEKLFERYGFNKVVQKSIKYYSEKKRSFGSALSLAGRYIDKLSAVFTEKGLPSELAFLPLIESGYRNHAASDKSAAGMWQFIPSTARRYGLKIDSWVDERRDPIKSTIAASEYLKDMYDKFGSWNLALAAYNAGEGKIMSAIQNHKDDDYWNISKTGFIANETKNFVPSFVAAAAIATYPEKYGFDNLNDAAPFIYDEVLIKTPMDLGTVALFTGVSLSDIKELNPELKYWCTPLNVKEYTLRIPNGTKEAFEEKVAEVGEDELFYVQPYKVKKGDTIGSIAKKLNSSTEAIIQMNSLGSNAVIIAGKEILVPVNITDPYKGGNVLSRQSLIKSKEL
ncbi:MAG: transglycosylase SLT domain-containing protein [Nitrospirae bacterium]|nr:transglycosylase SLT domain-containing protein [Nitrospirota bacterium]